MKRTTYSRRKDAVVKAAPARPLSPPPAKKTAPSRASGFGALFRRREDKPSARSTAPPLRGLVEDDGDDQDEDDGGDGVWSLARAPVRLTQYSCTRR